MAEITNIGVPQTANRAFVPLAIEAGIEEVIKSLIGLAIDNRTLLIKLKEVLWETNQPLSEGLNTQTLDAIIAYLGESSLSICEAGSLPKLLSEDGPISVSAAWDGGVADQLNVTYSEPPLDYTAEIYLDGVFMKHSEIAAVTGFCSDIISNVVTASTIRVLYRNMDGDITRFGPIATL